MPAGMAEVKARVGENDERCRRWRGPSAARSQTLRHVVWRWSLAAQPLDRVAQLALVLLGHAAQCAWRFDHPISGKRKQVLHVVIAGIECRQMPLALWIFARVRLFKC